MLATRMPRPLAPVAALTPGPGLIATAAGFTVTAPHVRLHHPSPLPPGWYEVQLGVRSDDKFTVRKRLELTFDACATDPDPRPPVREQFAWNRSFTERFLVRLTRPAASVRLDIWHAEGTITLNSFQLKPLSKTRIVGRAVREKVRLTRAYHCFTAAALRGVNLLRAGRFREFRSKLLNGLTDARAMRLGATAAAEVNAAWWRRHTLPSEVAAQVRACIDRMPTPPPLTVILPVEPHKLDEARLSAHSVGRQLYPHWQLILTTAGEPDLEPHLAALLGPDPRTEIVRVSKWAGLSAALGRAVTAAEAEHVLLLPPGVELAEHALYHAAETLRTAPPPGALGLRIDAPFGAPDGATGGTVWLTPARLLCDAAPATPTVADLGDWITATAPTAHTLDGVLAYPLDAQPFAVTARVGQVRVKKGHELCLAADVRGIGGYDHLTYALLRGLPSVGVELTRHPGSLVRSDLVPPHLMPPVRTRTARQPMLVAGPPFLVPRFGLDARVAAFTMWETDRLDPAWIPQLNRAGLILVPSAWQLDCFRADGVTVPLEVVPLGFDPVVFHPVGAPPEVCTFGTAGALTAGGVRKNAQWVIDTFRAAFPREADVRLRVKISPGSPGVETADDPRIDVIRAVLPNSELAEWYRSLTAYVNGSSGEGFGLHLIEAMACGRPLVTPNHSGLTAFFAPELGYPVEFRFVPAHGEIYRGTWCEPNRDSMIAQLRAVYANPNRVAKLGELSAVRATGFTWKTAGRQLAAALGRHGFLNSSAAQE